MPRRRVHGCELRRDRQYIWRGWEGDRVVTFIRLVQVNGHTLASVKKNNRLVRVRLDLLVPMRGVQR